MYAATVPHKTTTVQTLQNINNPDFDLDRDIINPEFEAEIALGMEASELSSDRKFIVNISTILISALIFLAILAWFDFIQTAFFVWLSPDNTQEIISPAIKFWYAILATIISLLLVILIYYYSGDQIK
jgi:hypothetical protein